MCINTFTMIINYQLLYTIIFSFSIFVCLCIYSTCNLNFIIILAVIMHVFLFTSVVKRLKQFSSCWNSVIVNGTYRKRILEIKLSVVSGVYMICRHDIYSTPLEHRCHISVTFDPHAIGNTDLSTPNVHKWLWQ